VSRFRNWIRGFLLQNNVAKIVMNHLTSISRTGPLVCEDSDQKGGVPRSFLLFWHFTHLKRGRVARDAEDQMGQQNGSVTRVLQPFTMPLPSIWKLVHDA
jgi:hypothetical protein